MKEEIKSARLVIQSERGSSPGSGLVGMLVRGKEESEFMFSEAATSWMGRRKSRQVYKKKNVALSLRVDGCFKLTVRVNPAEEPAVLEDETVLFEQLDEGISRMKEMVEFLSHGPTPGGKRVAKKKGGRG